MDLIEDLVKNAIAVEYKDLPPQVVEFTKLCVLDTLGALIAGCEAPGCQEAVELVKEWGGKPESSILLYGGKVPCHNAAMVNSILARALDFDTGAGPGVHFNASTIPTAISVGEMTNSSGQEIIAAIAVAEDLGFRINQTTNEGTGYGGFDPTGICTVFATAAVAGRLLGLNEEQMHNTLGLAFNKAAGSFQSNIDGALAVRYIQGFTSASGVLAAILAKRGITGVRNVLQGVYGYYHLFSHDKFDRNVLLNGLGRTFLAPNYTIFKRWPSCGGTLAATDGVFELLNEYKIRSEDVEEATVRLSPYGYNLVGHAFKVGANPEVDAQFSAQYAVANVLARGAPKLEHFTRRLIIQPQIQSVLPKVRVLRDKGVRNDLSAEVEITLKEGVKYRRRIDSPKGTPKNPLTKEDIIEKFKGCISFSPRPPTEETVREILEIVWNLDRLSKTSEVVRLLIPR